MALLLSTDAKPHEGFVRRILFDACRPALQTRPLGSVILNDKRLSEAELRRWVTYAERNGFLSMGGGRRS
jgi:hypothetical protein